MVTNIASGSSSLSAAELMTQIGVAVMGKAMDTVEQQGQAIEELVQSAAPDTHLLDVYA